MSDKKKQIRALFRDSVYKRDKYACCICGMKFSIDTANENLDAHHITPRELMIGGGYVKENGISLCKHGHNELSCHEKAEEWCKTQTGSPGFSPNELYEKIGSSHEKAVRASLKLS